MAEKDAEEDVARLVWREGDVEFGTSQGLQQAEDSSAGQAGPRV